MFLSFIEPVDEKIKLPSLSAFNFRCVEKNITRCFVNKTYRSCPKCLSFTFVNTTTVNCIECKNAMVDIFINWTAPKTASPIMNYIVAYGVKKLVFVKEVANDVVSTLPPVSNVGNT